ncbi:MAG TPA: HAD family hydrolase [Acidimicrobiales bacterium]
MTAPPISAVIFDWGGTLAEFVSTDDIDVWLHAGQRMAEVVDDRVLADALGPVDDHATAIRNELYAAEMRFWDRVRTHRRSARLTEIVADAATALGLVGVDEHLDHIAAGHLDAWDPHITHFPDVLPALEALRERGVRVGLLSNTHWPGEFHDALLARDGLVHLIDARVYSSDLAFLKPHRAAFEAALAAVGVDEPARVVFVGDRPYDDISGAKAAGMRAVLRPNLHVEAHDVEPDAVVDDLLALVDHLDRWGIDPIG